MNDLHFAGLSKVSKDKIIQPSLSSVWRSLVSVEEVIKQTSFKSPAKLDFGRQVIGRQAHQKSWENRIFWRFRALRCPIRKCIIYNYTLFPGNQIRRKLIESRQTFWSNVSTDEYTVYGQRSETPLYNHCTFETSVLIRDLTESHTVFIWETRYVTNDLYNVLFFSNSGVIKRYSDSSKAVSEIFFWCNRTDCLHPPVREHSL